jgi:hypothetical protein
MVLVERSLNPSDIEVLKKEIARDPAHFSWMTPAFFVEPDTQAYAVEDEQGPVMYLRLSSVLRVHVQFCEVDKERIRQALANQILNIAKRATKSSYKQIIFDSVSRGLIAFAKRYGFRSSADEYVLELPIIHEEKAT